MGGHGGIFEGDHQITRLVNYQRRVNPGRFAISETDSWLSDSWKMLHTVRLGLRYMNCKQLTATFLLGLQQRVELSRNSSRRRQSRRRGWKREPLSLQQVRVVA